MTEFKDSGQIPGKKDRQQGLSGGVSNLFNRVRENFGLFSKKDSKQQLPGILNDESFIEEIRKVWQDLIDDEGEYNPPVELLSLMEAPRIFYEQGALNPKFVQFVPLLMLLSEDEWNTFHEKRSLPEDEELSQRELRGPLGGAKLQDIPTFKKTLMQLRFVDILATRMDFDSAEEMVHHYQANSERALQSTLAKQGESLEDALKLYQVPREASKSMGYLLTLGSFYAAYMRQTFGQDLQYLIFSPDEMHMPMGMKRM